MSGILWVVGLVVAGVLAPDGKPWVERVLAAPGIVITLGSQQGECPEGEKEAGAITKVGKVGGCWFERDETVWIWWGDGDRSAIPSKMFKGPEGV